jgi:hypothetical protein
MPVIVVHHTVAAVPDYLHGRYGRLLPCSSKTKRSPNRSAGTAWGQPLDHVFTELTSLF